MHDLGGKGVLTNRLQELCARTKFPVRVIQDLVSTRQSRVRTDALMHRLSLPPVFL